MNESELNFWEPKGRAWTRKKGHWATKIKVDKLGMNTGNGITGIPCRASVKRQKGSNMYIYVLTLFLKDIVYTFCFQISTTKKLSFICVHNSHDYCFSHMTCSMKPALQRPNSALAVLVPVFRDTVVLRIFIIFGWSSGEAFHGTNPGHSLWSRYRRSGDPDWSTSQHYVQARHGSVCTIPLTQNFDW